jgi:hypothetical protein
MMKKQKLPIQLPLTMPSLSGTLGLSRRRGSFCIAIPAWPSSIRCYSYTKENCDMHGDYGYKTRKPDAAEALAWLREAKKPDERTITGGDGEGWRGAEAIAVVQELYDLGAVCVTAVEINGRVEKSRHQDTSTLIIELPRDPEKRARLFEWEANFAEEQGWDPATDDGRDYMLIWRD